jgi:hypothetical protein
MILRNRDTVIILFDTENGILLMVAARKRVKKYRSEGGAADLVRVEVLVPPSARDEILAIASRLRAEYRATKELRELYDDALRSYRVRILDNVDLDRLPDLRSRAAVVARALIDRGDARAFAMGRKMLDRVGALAA